MIEVKKPSIAARRLLLDGNLLSATEGLALRMSNNYDFARRIAQEFSLIYAGQGIRFLDVGQLDKAYSHAGLYAPPGLGKDFAWKLLLTSNVFPTDTFRMRKLENVTLAALTGTITESTIIPPATVTEDIIFVGEFATLMRGNVAASIAADLRAMQESGEYARRLAKIGLLKEILETQPNSRRAQYVRNQLEECRKMGMTIDLLRSEIHVKTTTSWIVASARFGSETGYGRSLLNMGDINRYRWRSYLPDRSERVKVTSEVGSLPPISIDVEEKSACKEAWSVLISSLQSGISEGLEIPRDEQSYFARRKVWDETQKILVDVYKSEMDNLYFDQLVNLRTRAEFTRLMYQHAALKQFSRDQGCDFSQPYNFIIDYNEDGEFARQLWISDYVPGMIDVINDVNKRSAQAKRSAKVTLTAKGREIVVERLNKGPEKREELLRLMAKVGIDRSLFDNSILRSLINEKIIRRDKFGWYSLTTDSEGKVTLDEVFQE